MLLGTHSQASLPRSRVASEPGGHFLGGRVLAAEALPAPGGRQDGRGDDVGPGDRPVEGEHVVVADDAVLFREGMAWILAGVGFEVIGQASDGSLVVALARSEDPTS